MFNQDTVSPSSLRKSISYVLQQPLIFSGTIFNNIKYAYPQQKNMVIKQAKKQGSPIHFKASFEI